MENTCYFVFDTLPSIFIILFVREIYKFALGNNMQIEQFILFYLKVFWRNLQDGCYQRIDTMKHMKY